MLEYIKIELLLNCPCSLPSTLYLFLAHNLALCHCISSSSNAASPLLSCSRHLFGRRIPPLDDMDFMSDPCPRMLSIFCPCSLPSTLYLFLAHNLALCHCISSSSNAASPLLSCSRHLFGRRIPPLDDMDFMSDPCPRMLSIFCPCSLPSTLYLFLAHNLALCHCISSSSNAASPLLSCSRHLFGRRIPPLDDMDFMSDPCPRMLSIFCPCSLPSTLYLFLAHNLALCHCISSSSNAASPILSCSRHLFGRRIPPLDDMDFMSDPCPRMLSIFCPCSLPSTLYLFLAHNLALCHCISSSSNAASPLLSCSRHLFGRRIPPLDDMDFMSDPCPRMLSIFCPCSLPSTLYLFLAHNLALCHCISSSSNAASPLLSCSRHLFGRRIPPLDDMDFMSDPCPRMLSIFCPCSLPSTLYLFLAHNLALCHCISSSSNAASPILSCSRHLFGRRIPPLDDMDFMSDPCPRMLSIFCPCSLPSTLYLFLAHNLALCHCISSSSNAASPLLSCSRHLFGRRIPPLDDMDFMSDPCPRMLSIFCPCSLPSTLYLFLAHNLALCHCISSSSNAASPILSCSRHLFGRRIPPLDDMDFMSDPCPRMLSIFCPCSLPSTLYLFLAHNLELCHCISSSSNAASPLLSCSRHLFGRRIPPLDDMDFMSDPCPRMLSIFCPCSLPSTLYLFLAHNLALCHCISSSSNAASPLLSCSRHLFGRRIPPLDDMDFMSDPCPRMLSIFCMMCSRVPLFNSCMSLSERLLFRPIILFKSSEVMTTMSRPWTLSLVAPYPLEAFEDN